MHSSNNTDGASRQQPLTPNPNYVCRVRCTCSYARLVWVFGFLVRCASSRQLATEAVRSHCMDVSSSVREATIELLGELFRVQPQCLGTFLSIVSTSLQDKSVAVRKRTVRLVADLISSGSTSSAAHGAAPHHNDARSVGGSTSSRNDPLKASDADDADEGEDEDDGDSDGHKGRSTSQRHAGASMGSLKLLDDGVCRLLHNLVRRVQDDEARVKELVRKPFVDLWFKEETDVDDVVDSMRKVYTLLSSRPHAGDYMQSLFQLVCMCVCVRAYVCVCACGVSCVFALCMEHDTFFVCVCGFFLVLDLTGVGE